MKIHFTGHHLEITPALQSLTEKKFNKLENHFDTISSIHVTFSIQKLLQVAEATIHLNKDYVHAHAESDDMYASIDALIDKLHIQLQKYKEKHSDQR
jgi:putative sigma-54 modulation protein